MEKKNLQLSEKLRLIQHDKVFYKKFKQELKELKEELAQGFAKRALASFQEVLSKANHPGRLAAIIDAGWQELMPSENTWSFFHKSFPGLIIYWLPNKKPSIRRVGVFPF